MSIREGLIVRLPKPACSLSATSKHPKRSSIESVLSPLSRYVGAFQLGALFIVSQRLNLLVMQSFHPSSVVQLSLHSGKAICEDILRQDKNEVAGRSQKLAEKGGKGGGGGGGVPGVTQPPSRSGKPVRWNGVAASQQLLSSDQQGRLPS